MGDLVDLVDLVDLIENTSIVGKENNPVKLATPAKSVNAVIPVSKVTSQPSLKCPVQQRLLQRRKQGELPLVDAGEALGCDLKDVCLVVPVAIGELGLLGNDWKLPIVEKIFPLNLASVFH